MPALPRPAGSPLRTPARPCSEGGAAHPAWPTRGPGGGAEDPAAEPHALRPPLRSDRRRRRARPPPAGRARETGHQHLAPSSHAPEPSALQRASLDHQAAVLAHPPHGPPGWAHLHAPVLLGGTAVPTCVGLSNGNAGQWLWLRGPEGGTQWCFGAVHGVEPPTTPGAGIGQAEGVPRPSLESLIPAGLPSPTTHSRTWALKKGVGAPGHSPAPHRGLCSPLLWTLSPRSLTQTCPRGQTPPAGWTHLSAACGSPELRGAGGQRWVPPWPPPPRRDNKALSAPSGGRATGGAHWGICMTQAPCLS